MKYLRDLCRAWEILQGIDIIIYDGYTVVVEDHLA